MKQQQFYMLKTMDGQMLMDVHIAVQRHIKAKKGG